MSNLVTGGLSLLKASWDIPYRVVVSIVSMGCVAVLASAPGYSLRWKELDSLGVVWESLASRTSLGQPNLGYGSGARLLALSVP